MLRSCSLAASRCFVVCGALATPAVAQTELYIGEYAFQAARMSAVGTDGTNPHLLFNLPAADWLPLGVTYSPSAGRLFWMDSAGGSEVHSATTTGGSPAVLSPVSGFARGMSLDASGRIYFSTNNTVQRMNADGSGLVTIFTSTNADPVGNPRVDATNGHVYVGAVGEIIRMNLDGGNIKTIITGLDQPRAIALDVAEGYIYWIDADTISDYVGRARLDDTGFQILIDYTPNNVTSSFLIDILVDPVANTLYFAEEVSGTVWKANTDGTNAAILYTAPTGLSPSGLTFNTGEPAQALMDCNSNGIHDDVDIAGGAPDCDNNGRIDTCQVNPCPPRVFLVDQGSNAALNLGRTVGQPSEFQVFQPFDVPAPGWVISEVALDGWNTNYIASPVLTVKLFPDSGTLTTPNETTALATTTMDLRFGINSVSWQYAPFNATLAPGRYWVRVESNHPQTYSGALNHGFSGLQSRSRGSSGNFGSFASPIALRLVQGSACGSADFDGDGDTGTDLDIEAFFACLGGDCCATCGSADFDGDGDTGTDLDIEAFFRVLGGGEC